MNADEIGDALVVIGAAATAAGAALAAMGERWTAHFKEEDD